MPNPEEIKSFLFLSTELRADGFGFISYAEQVAPNANIRRPLRQVFSFMRAQGCRFLLEEELTPSEYCMTEKRILEDFFDPAKLGPIDRTVTRVSFYRVRSDQREQLPKKLAPEKIFTHDRNQAMCRTKDDRWNFLKLCEFIECLGYLYIYTDSLLNGRITSSYTPFAVAKCPERDSMRGPFIHSTGNYELHVLDSKEPAFRFCVEGSAWAQQEGSVWCCAHAAMSVVITNLRQYKNGGTHVDYAEINGILRKDYTIHKPGAGLSHEEILHALLDYAGIEATPAYSRAPLWGTSRGVLDEVHRVLSTAYYAVECGLPAILSFRTGNAAHAVTVVGHTFDPSFWSPQVTQQYFGNERKSYLPSHEWVDRLIVQDDNIGPYASITPSMLLGTTPAVTVPKFPGSIIEFPEIVEEYAADILTGPNFQERTYFNGLTSDARFKDRDKYEWLYRLLRHVEMRTYVLRTVPILADSYFDWLKGDNETCSGKAQKIVEESSDLMETLLRHIQHKRTWLVEISVPELYQWNNHRLGEVLFQEPGSGEFGADDLELLLIRLPGVLSLPGFSEAGYDFEHHEIYWDYHYRIESLDHEDFQKIWNFE